MNWKDLILELLGSKSSIKEYDGEGGERIIEVSIDPIFPELFPKKVWGASYVFADKKQVDYRKVLVFVINWLTADYRKLMGDNCSNPELKK